ncbi:STAS domain-containing protein [uncultured Cytophaga sp.]|uniref:STAS domain-containing protein n=1 Tax=uncultured Cytophaga sp. TaxID=160238 RepID=UPI0026073DA3|nr:STAS domain-containing protein [uncultured Cytophaga sp.]
MKAVLEIHIASEIDSIINTREAALNIKTQIQQTACTQVELNFDGVEFVSRSFADQLHKEKVELANQGILVVLVNASTSVMDMFRTVAKTQDATDRERHDIPVYKITTMDAFSEYLYSI